MTRTITNPIEDSNLDSSIIRGELQLLETEISNTTLGHNHDGTDSKLIEAVSMPSGIDAVKLADGSVTNTELQYINTLSSNAQTQITSKIAKTTNITALNETGIADGEIAVFNLTNKDIRTSDKTIVTSLGSDDTTVPTSKAVKDITDTFLTKATYDANSIVKSDTDNTPIVLTVAEQTLVGRKTGGNIDDLSASDVRTILNVADGAEVNVQADWNAVSGDSFINNKPTLGTASAQDTTAFAPALGTDDNYVTDAEKIVIGNTSGTNTGDQNMSAIKLRKNPYFYTDFIVGSSSNAIAPFTGTAISSGTLGNADTGLVTVNHPGVSKFSSSTSANSGYVIFGSPAQLLLGGGEEIEVIFNLSLLTDSTFRFGFNDIVSASDAVDGVYLEIPSTGVAVGKTSNNSTRSTTATGYTLSINTWYRLKITLNSDATLATYTIYNDAETVLWSDTLATNIPTARETGVAIIAFNAGTTANALCHFDFLGVAINRALIR